MTKNFDTIVKEGKDKVNTGKSKKDIWKDCISAMINLSTKLNAMYGIDDKHHFMLEHSKCQKCNRAAYLLAIKNIEDPKQIIRFHNSAWKVISKDVYHCEACK